MIDPENLNQTLIGKIFRHIMACGIAEIQARTRQNHSGKIEQHKLRRAFGDDLKS
jgi:hypothetical protein